MTRQLPGQHPGRHPQHLSRRLPRAGGGGIIQHSQPLSYPRLQRLQQRGLPGQRRARRWLAEHLTHHHRQLPRPATTRRRQFRSGGLDSDRGGLPQRTLLITAEHQPGQPPAAGIGEQPNQPPRQVIRHKHHASSLPQPVAGRAGGGASEICGGSFAAEYAMTWQAARARGSRRLTLRRYHTRGPQPAPAMRRHPHGRARALATFLLGYGQAGSAPAWPPERPPAMFEVFDLSL